jgi:hypothetical protein
MMSLDSDSHGKAQPGDKLSLNPGSGDGVIFADRAGIIIIRHVEVITIQRESGGEVQTSDKSSLNPRSRDGVVFANRVSEKVRHQEGSAL